MACSSGAAPGGERRALPTTSTCRWSGVRFSGAIADDGWKVLGLSWLPEIAETTMTAADADAIFARLRELLGVAIEVEYCPHAAGPPVCWCRKPLPGLGVVFQQRHRLDPSKCLYVGAGAQDPGFARRLGFAYRDASEFFGVDR